MPRKEYASRDELDVVAGFCDLVIRYQINRNVKSGHKYYMPPRNIARIIGVSSSVFDKLISETEVKITKQAKQRIRKLQEIVDILYNALDSHEIYEWLLSPNKLEYMKANRPIDYLLKQNFDIVKDAALDLRDAIDLKH